VAPSVLALASARALVSVELVALAEVGFVRRLWFWFRVGPLTCGRFAAGGGFVLLVQPVDYSCANANSDAYADADIPPMAAAILISVTALTFSELRERS